MEVPLALRPLVDGIKSYHKSGLHADLDIICGGQQWKVHKAIICPQSEFFQSAVGIFKEGHDGEIELKEDHPQTVDAFIHYLYNFDYGDCGNSQGDVAAIVLDVRMFIIADKYNVEPLIDLAAAKFKRRCENEWTTPEFGEAALELYSIGIQHNDTLRDIVIGTITGHATDLLDANRVEDFSKLREALEQTELGADVSTALASKIRRSTFKCPKCANTFRVSVPAKCKFSCPEKCYSEDAAWWTSKQPKAEQKEG